MMTRTVTSTLAHHGLRIDIEGTKRSASAEDIFFWKGDVFCDAGVESLNLTDGMATLDHSVKRSFKNHLLDFAKAGDYSASSLLNLVAGLRKGLSACPTKSFDLSWMAKAVDCGAFSTAKGAADKFFIYWKQRDPTAVGDSALELLLKSKGKTGRSGNALSDDPTLGWLTDIEYDALLQSVWRNYDRGASCSQVTLIRLLSMQYARRPVQLAYLKIEDFQFGRANDDSGITGKRIRFPGAKDLDAEISFRDSKFEVHPVADHIWDLFVLQRERIKNLFEECLETSLATHELKLLPIFCTATRVRNAISTLVEHFGVDFRTNLGSRLFHLHPHTVSSILQWKTNRSLYGQQGKVHNVTPPISHRTGASLVVNATRMRHTRARQLARLGTPKHILSHWMGHTSEKSIDSYYSDPAEDARRLDSLMAPLLTPLALVFSGNLIDDESKATRADDPTSRIELSNAGNLSSVGNCGRYSFCGATSIPLPCYRCKHFEPLVDAPHHEVLEALLQREREEAAMPKIGGARALLIPIDLSADKRAVIACINLCRLRKSELDKS